MHFDFNNPYLSTRLPVFARNVVSTSHPLAAQAGLRMLWKGGNAVDAAIAAAAAITICEPVSNGLGSDAFCILWDGQQLHGLNASGGKLAFLLVWQVAAATGVAVMLICIGTAMISMIPVARLDPADVFRS